MKRPQRAAELLAGLGPVERRAAQLAPDEALVEHELVAALDEQVAGGVAQADTDRMLAVLAQLVHQRGVIAVTGHDRKDVDPGAGEDDFHGVDR